MHTLMDRPLCRWLMLVIGLFLSYPWEITSLFWSGARIAMATMLLSYATMPLIIRLAWYWNAIDRPDNHRRLHRQETPRIGGVAVLLAANFTLLLNFNYSLELKGICISALMVAMLSLRDDVCELSAGIKLLGQLLALILLMACGIHIEFVAESWWGNSLEYLITAIWIIGITNAFNFLDGINGLAASLAATVCLMMAVLAWHTGQPHMLFLCLAIAGAALGFLPDNARYQVPARSFLGDVGSTYLGWMMACVAVMGDWSSAGTLQAYSAPLLIFSVMIFDMIYTTVARIARGDVHSFREWIAFVGRDHFHHRLMDLGCNQKQAVGVIVTLSLMMGLTALAIVAGDPLRPWLLLAQAVVIFSVLSFLMLRKSTGAWKGVERREVNDRRGRP
ncbi:MAG: MraY family glycosyltransferase [Mariprofundaceae bacterium]